MHTHTDTPHESIVEPVFFKDRVWSSKMLVASGLASALLGGLGGAALATAADNGEPQRGPGTFQGGPPPMQPANQQN